MSGFVSNAYPEENPHLEAGPVAEAQPKLYDGSEPIHFTALELPGNQDPTQVQELLNKIIWAFRVYPFMSHTLCQIAVGTNVPSGQWRPIVDALIKKDYLKSIQLYTQSSAGRSQTVNIMCLTNATYDPSLVGVSPLPGTITT